MRRCKQAHSWLWHHRGASSQRSGLQAAVLAALRRLGFVCDTRGRDRRIAVDIELPREGVALEVDGPLHFAVNARTRLGETALKHRLLRRQGVRYAAVCSWDWPRGHADQERYLLRLLQLRAPGGVSRSPVEFPASHGPAEVAAGDHEHTSEKAAATAATAAAAASAVPWEAKSARKDEGAVDTPASSGEPSTESARRDDRAVAQGDAEPIAERAKRLDLLQYRKGALSKQQLLRKAARRQLQLQSGRGAKRQ